MATDGTPPVPRLALGAGAAGVTGLASNYLTEYLDKIRIAIGPLDDEQIWRRSGVRSNSIGNLMLHLAGNLSLWVRASLGGRDFVRDRAAEFAARGGSSGEELLDQLGRVVEDCRLVISGLTEADLSRQDEIQGYRVDGLGALIHAVEHMSYHTGQIVLLAKQAMTETGGDLDFYPHLNGPEED